MTMPSTHPDSRRKTVNRRWVLTALASTVTVGGALALHNADAFTSASTPRQTTATIGTDSDGVIGISIIDPVQRNNQELLTVITNNTDATMMITVELNDCTQGTLYGNGQSGCSVNASLDTGETVDVDIETGESDGATIPFTVSADRTGFSGSITRSTTAESGQQAGNVTITHVNQFRTRHAQDEWTLRRLRVESDPHDLDRIEFEIQEAATGNVVATDEILNINEVVFDESGQGNNPAFEWEPDDPSYNVASNVSYQLRIRAFDVEGNVDSHVESN